MQELKVMYQSPSALKPYDRNARTHSKKQIKQIGDSIREFGFVNPVLIDAGGRIVAGHGRVAAAKLLGIEDIPVVRLEHMTKAQVQAYAVADNRLAELAGWDKELLALELQDLTDLQIEFDPTVTGFGTPEIDLLIEGLGGSSSVDAADQVPEIDETVPTVTRPGELWRLGSHRLFCGDATNAESFARLLGRERAQMVFTDPPYNVPVDGHVCGLGRVRHAEFAMASGEMSEGQFTAFLETALGHLAAYSADGSIHFICMDWRHMFELLAAARGVYAELKNLCVWNKTNGGMGSLYRSKHELVFVFKNGTAAHINNVELGRHGRYRTNVWDFAGINTFGANRMDELAMHPTVKPVALVADAIKDCTRRDGIVLDCFGGSGTTLIAAERTGRRARVMEMESKYVDATIERFEQVTGQNAIHAESGLTFAQMKDWREIEGEAA
jgi:DNA modification methylase